MSTPTKAEDDELISRAILGLKLTPRLALDLSCDFMDLGRAVLAAERERVSKPKCPYCRGRGRVNKDFREPDGSSYTEEVACPRCDS